jgi:hypothetical protein
MAGVVVRIARKRDANRKGPTMPPRSLEDRVAVLEQEVSELKARQGNGPTKDWRRTIGRFTDNPGMKELFAEALKLREADRRKMRRRSTRS